VPEQKKKWDDINGMRFERQVGFGNYGSDKFITG